MQPDPVKRVRHFPVVSVDDHVCEPAQMFEGRLPRRYSNRAPRVAATSDGADAWYIDDTVVPQVGFNAAVGRPPSRQINDPIRFADMRAGTYDIHERVADMNLDGVYASLCFPSYLAGFGGVRLQSISRDLGFSLALVRAWNDWMAEEWAGTYPERIIPLQLAWLHDPKLAAKEIEMNAARGFRAVTFPESPRAAGFPSLHSGYWDEFLAACAATRTVINVHTGSAGSLPKTDDDAPSDLASAMFGAGYALSTTLDWLYSRCAVKFPDLSISISEGGIGWVPALLDRLDHIYRKQGDRHDLWVDSDMSATEVLQRNFFFCLLDEPSATVQFERIGVDRIMFETDYPHSDSSWPDSQDLLHDHLVGAPTTTVEKIAWRNASELFGHEVPQAVQEDPNAF